VRGTIRRLDGRIVKLTREEHVDPGCHLIEVESSTRLTGRPTTRVSIALESPGTSRGAVTSRFR
jgi:hypothetical protein